MKSPIDYTKDNTVNLIASISNAISEDKGLHNELQNLSSSYIQQFDNVVLFVIDGLPYSFLQENIPQVFELFNNQVLHPVFPSATTPALTSLATWRTPQEHWLPWRYTFFKEIGILSSVLPFTTRSWVALNEKTDFNYYYDTPSIYESSKRTNYVFNREYLINSDYSKSFAKKATRIWCLDFNDMCIKLGNIIKESKDKKYCYAYDPDFDSLCHAYWVHNDKTVEYAKNVFDRINQLLQEIEWTNTLVLLTADHGMIDSTPERNIQAEDYPEFMDMLSIPLSWETRAVFCHVKAGMGEKFEQWVNLYFADYCECYKSSQLLDDWWFWEWNIHQWFLDRIWDYVLIMKENYILVDSILGQKREPIIWNHWWISGEEINIPLLWKEL